VEFAPFSKRLKRYLRYWLIRALLMAMSWLPVSAAARLGEIFGSIAFLLARRERRNALDSLGRAFPELSSPERERLAKESFRHLGRSAFELGCIHKIDAQIERWVQWPEAGRRELESALARGRGVVFVSGHVGNWELLARRVALAGFPAWTIAKETTDWRLTELVERFRKQGRVQSIWRGQEGAAKQMLRALKSGEILGMLIDQDTRVQSVFVPFFGHPAATPRAAADLVFRTGAAVVVGFCQRKQDGFYQLLMKEIMPTRSGDPEADVVALTAALTAEIEGAIRSVPEQWVWSHRRWKTQLPLGAA